MCRVVAIGNQKGGTAKSTTACNLGVGLVREGQRVLLIDADSQEVLRHLWDTGNRILWTIP